MHGVAAAQSNSNPTLGCVLVVGAGYQRENQGKFAKNGSTEAFVTDSTLQKTILFCIVGITTYTQHCSMGVLHL